MFLGAAHANGPDTSDNQEPGSVARDAVANTSKSESGENDNRTGPVGGGAAIPRKRPLTIDDVLNIEDIGSAIVVEDGRTLIFEWIPPYQKAPNVGLFSDRSFPRSLGRIYAIDLSAPGPPVELFRQRPGVAYWIGSRSPDQSRFAIYSLEGEQLRAGVLSLKTREVRWFDFTPSCCSNSWEPVWITNDELVFSALPQGEIPALLYRSAVAAGLNNRWQKTFSGLESSATVIDSHINQRPAERGDLAGRILLANSVTGEVKDVASGLARNISVSPDKRSIAIALAAERYPPRSATANLTAENQMTARVKIVVSDPAGGGWVEREPCVTCNVAPYSLTWSSDGNFLIFLAEDLADNSGPVPHLYRLDVRTLSVDVANTRDFVFACNAQREAALALLDSRGDKMLASGHTAVAGSAPTQYGCRSKQRDDWYLLSVSERPIKLTAALQNVSSTLQLNLTGEPLILADNVLWRVADGFELQKVLELKRPHGRDDYWKSVPPRSVHVGPKTLVFQSSHSILTLHVSSGAFRQYDRPASSAKVLSIDDRAHLAVFRTDSARGTAVLLSKAGRNREVLKLNGFLAGIAEGTPTRVRYRNAAGHTRTSCLLLPPDHDESKSYPTIVIAYPEVLENACYRIAINEFNPLNYQLLAARGYAVLFPATPRSDILTAHGPTAGLPDAVMAAVDAAIAAGYTDPQQLGVFGFSQGFNEALRTIETTDRFKAAVAAYGIANFASHYGQAALIERINHHFVPFFANMSRYEQAVGESTYALGAPPWEEPARYVESSPVFFADRIHTPVLIIHSDMDGFPLAQSEEIFAALFRLRKEARYVTYWGEAHWNLSPENIRDVWMRVFDWYDQHLKGVPSARPSTH